MRGVGVGMSRASVAFAGFAFAALTLAGCSSSQGWLPTSFLEPTARDPGPGNAAPTRDSDKIVKLPARPEDLACPDVEVNDGGATARVGGPESAQVRYQFNIADTVRQCAPQGDQFALTVGVAGRLLIGPAGAPGSYSTTLHVEVKREADGKVIFSKAYPVAVNTGGADGGPYRVVTEPILLPLTRARLDMDYDIFIGLGGGGTNPVGHRRHRQAG